MNSATPESVARLASGKWRILHSAWLLAPIFGLGIFSFVGFVYVALRVRTRKFWIACAVTFLASGMLLFIDTSRFGGLIILVWLGEIVYGFILNFDYLLWRASARPWYLQSAARAQGQGAPAQPPSAGSPARPPSSADQGTMGVSGAEYYAPPPAGGSAAPPPFPTPPPVRQPGETPEPGRLLDVNAATGRELSALPGIDASLAERVVSARERQGAFRDLDDMVRKAALQPHELIRFRGLVTFGHTPPPPGRPTDKPGIRRLDY
ncbi:helix-hairpin-helix domain-containing protein [Arthrobacter sp. zg-Y820]|uniref:ComEA family DNA-binding protein n=1 Tax=unclassified Arthrobacter TaxID=235627 RepID=UPI001E2C33EC|nr:MULTISPECIES: helix-hairpin-helix domain-containing protein [unclassified Arthrobacter]MCC9195322.1 helix-hairpin-helix domain-containing protein [Arthrobacter sp. zg-Y820]MDK1278181.1 helix-hairpin-helix domain-containing protein [Arthrobacter sp. zg.Y820]WIB10067.1 helix-hairpin-helix domain-containing protein [Arthrobacter sp. zg-Y820]